MNRERVVITNFQAGQVTQRYAGRVDLEVFRNAAAELSGVVVRPDGGVSRRPGSVHVRKGAGITPAEEGMIKPDSIPGIVLWSEQDGTTRMPYLAFVRDDNFLQLLNLYDSTEEQIATSLSPGTPLSTTGSFTAEDSFDTQYVQIWNDSASDLLDLQTRTTAERISKEIGVVFQNRLITADRKFGRIYFSEPLKLLNNELEREETFEDTDGNEEQIMVPTGALEIRADFYGVERIEWMRAQESLYLGTNMAEYELASSFAAFNDEPGGVSVLPITRVGSKRSEYLGKSMIVTKDRRLVRIQWGREGGYQSSSMMELLDNSEIEQLATIELGSHNYLFALDIDKRLWVFTESQGRDIAGWSKFMDDVWAIYSFDQDLYAVIERDGEFWIEVFGIDNLHFGPEPRPIQKRAFASQTDRSDQSMYVYIGDDELRQHPGPPDTTMECWEYVNGEWTSLGTRTTDSDGLLFIDYLTARSFIDTESPRQSVVYARPEQAVEYGAYIKTLPIEIAAQNGPALSQPTRIHGVVVYVEATTAMEVKVPGSEWVLKEFDEPYSGPVEFTLGGGNRKQSYVEIRSVGDHPLTVMSIQADVTKGDM